MATNDNRDSLVHSGKSILKTPGRRLLPVRLLVGDSNPKTLAAAAAPNPATEKSFADPKGLSYIDIPANVCRVSRPPVGSSRLSAVTSAASANPPNKPRAGSLPASLQEVAPAWQSSHRHDAPQVIVRKHHASKAREILSATSSNSCSLCENPSQEDATADYLVIMERFVDEPEEIEYLRAAEAAMRNRMGGISAGFADSAKLGGGGGRGKEFACQPTKPQPSSNANSEFLPAGAQFPSARPQHHLPKSQRQNVSAGGSPPASSSPPQQHHHMRRDSSVGDSSSDMLESESSSLSMRESRPITARGNWPAHERLSRERSRSFAEPGTSVRQKQSAATITRSNSIAFGIGAGKGATSASQEHREQREQRRQQREQWQQREQRREQREQRREQWEQRSWQEPQRRLQGFELPVQRELELLVDALKAEIRVKDQLLEASENERKLLDRELRGVWEHVGEMEHQRQDEGEAREREIVALRKQGGGERSMAQRRGGSEGDLAVGDFVMEMERAVGELALKLEANEIALHISEGRNVELARNVANLDFELSRAKSALRQAEQERDWLVEEMEAALASWTAGGPDIPAALAVPSTAEAEQQELAKLASGLEAAQRELQAVKAQRDLVLMAVGQPKRPHQDQRSQRGGRVNLNPNRARTPSPVHFRSLSRSLTSSRSGPMQLLRDYTMDPSHMAAAHRRSRHKGFPPHPTVFKSLSAQ